MLRSAKSKTDIAMNAVAERSRSAAATSPDHLHQNQPIMKELFNICVDILNWIADLFGISYEAANIWIFVIIHPLLTLVLIVAVIYQRGVIRGLRQQKKD
jgi:hypothetical protein